MASRVLPLTDDEHPAIHRLVRSRTEPARLLERAQLMQRAAQGEAMGTIAAALRCSVETVRLWVNRCTAHGVDGLRDRPRAGRPPTYSPEGVSEVIASSLSNPRDLGLPFRSWTLDRLATHLHEPRGIALQRSRSDEIPPAEGLRWRTQETWFGERVDPTVAETRARSSRSRRSRRQVG